jgi:hypothetical protein
VSTRFRVVLIALPLALTGLAVLAWWALDAWLESAGGRGAIERVLSEQSGYAVSLEEEFEVVLLPAPGVDGTGLHVRDADTGETVLRGGEYAVSLALRPLFERTLDVDRLTVGDIRFGPGGDAANAFRVNELTIVGFQAGRQAEFSLDLGPYGEAAGEFTWTPAASTLDLQVEWGGFLVPRLDLGFAGAYDPVGFWFDSIDLRVDGQALTGTGCYRFAEPGGLDLDLAADRLDLDALDIRLPGDGGGAGFDAIPLNLRLTLGTLLRGDTRAEGVVLHLGEDPLCRRPET